MFGSPTTTPTAGHCEQLVLSSSVTVSYRRHGKQACVRMCVCVCVCALCVCVVCVRMCTICVPGTSGCRRSVTHQACSSDAAYHGASARAHVSGQQTAELTPALAFVTTAPRHVRGPRTRPNTRRVHARTRDEPSARRPPRVDRPTPTHTTAVSRAAAAAAQPSAR